MLGEKAGKEWSWLRRKVGEGWEERLRGRLRNSTSMNMERERLKGEVEGKAEVS